MIHPQSRHQAIGGWLELLGDVDATVTSTSRIGGAMGGFGPAGASYVLYGRPRADWPKAELWMDDEIEAGRAVAIRHDSCGFAQVAGPGDLGGDGFPDLVTAHRGGFCVGERRATACTSTWTR